MSGTLTLALAAFALLQQTDTVIPLDGATRLSVENPGGSIVVTTWDRPSVRIQAEHSSRRRSATSPTRRPAGWSES